MVSCFFRPSDVQGVSLSLVAWSHSRHDLGGQMLVIFIIALAACEAAIALAMILMLFEAKGNLDIAVWHELREANQPPLEEDQLPPGRRQGPATWPQLSLAGCCKWVAREGAIPRRRV